MAPLLLGRRNKRASLSGVPMRHARRRGQTAQLALALAVTSRNLNARAPWSPLVRRRHWHVSHADRSQSQRSAGIMSAQSGSPYRARARSTTSSAVRLPSANSITSALVSGSGSAPSINQVASPCPTMRMRSSSWPAASASLIGSPLCQVTDHRCPRHHPAAGRRLTHEARAASSRQHPSVDGDRAEWRARVLGMPSRFP